MDKIINFSNFRLNESNEESNKYYDRWLEVYDYMKDCFLELRERGWTSVDKVITSRRGIWNKMEMQSKVTEYANIFSTPGIYDISSMKEYPKISCYMANSKYGDNYFKKNTCEIDKSGVIKDGDIRYNTNINTNLDEELNYELEDVLVYLSRLSSVCKDIKFEIYNLRKYLIVKFSGVIKEG